MLMLNWTLAVRAGDPESATFSVNVELPAAVGVPLIVPVLAPSVSPVGRLPCETDQVYGEMPPEVANVTLYAVPTWPAARAPPAVVMAGLAGMFSVTLPVWVAFAFDVAVMVTVNAVATVAGAV